MRKRRVFQCGAIVAAQLLTVNQSAAGPNDNAKVLIHIAQVDFSVCSSPRVRPSCVGVRERGDLYPAIHLAYLLVMDGNAEAGVGSVHCGISYDSAFQTGVDVFSWTLCGTSESPAAGVNGPWPSSGSSNTLQWNAATNCQRFEPGGAGSGVVAAAGYFYLGAYTPDILAVIPAPSDGVATVQSCLGDVDIIEGGGIQRTPSHLGFARFSSGGAEPGYNPCGLNTPVEPTSWGRIKSLMGR